MNRYLPVTATRFGNFSFTNQFTGNAIRRLPPGLPTNVVREAPYPVQYNRFRDWSFYGQDDWKVTQNLTLSYGLRYEFNETGEAARWQHVLVRSSRAARSSFRLSASRQAFAAGFPANIPSSPRQTRIDEVCGMPDKNNFGPRFGFSYMVDKKTVLRGGWGVYYGHFSAAVPAFLVAGPYAVSTTANNAIRNGQAGVHARRIPTRLRERWVR